MLLRYCRSPVTSLHRIERKYNTLCRSSVAIRAARNALKEILYIGDHTMVDHRSAVRQIFWWVDSRNKYRMVSATKKKKKKTKMKRKVEWKNKGRKFYGNSPVDSKIDVLSRRWRRSENPIYKTLNELEASLHTHDTHRHRFTRGSTSSSSTIAHGNERENI